MKITLYSECLPSLLSGKYKIQTAQNVSANNENINANSTFEFVVPENNKIISRYPLPNSTGIFDNIFPQIVFESAAFPWEKSEKVCILLFNENERKQVTVSEKNAVIPNELLEKIRPTDSDIDFLSSVRCTEDNLKYSILISNRLPFEGKNSVMTVRFDGTKTDDKTAVTLFDEFVFYCIADPNEGCGFSDVGKKLNVRMLSIIPDENQKTNEYIKERFENGYVALPYKSHTGENGFCWYRGLFSPVNTDFNGKLFSSAQETVLYDKDYGVFDFSLACAFENARAYLLSNKKFFTDLSNLRCKIEKIILQKSNNLSENNKNEILDFVNNKLFDCLNSDKISDNKLKSFSVENTEFNLDKHWEEAVKECAEDISKIKKIVFDYIIGKSQKFENLSIKNELIPPENMCLFYLDKNIMQVSADGIFSTGIENGRLFEINDKLKTLIMSDIFSENKGNLSGFIINSRLVSVWHNFKITAALNDKEVPLIYKANPSDGVLLCVYSDMPDTIIFKEPPHTIAHSLDEKGCLVLGEETMQVTGDGGKMRNDGQPESHAVDVTALCNAANLKNSAEYVQKLLTAPEQIIIDIRR